MWVPFTDYSVRFLGLLLDYLNQGLVVNQRLRCHIALRLVSKRAETRFRQVLRLSCILIRAVQNHKAFLTN